MKARSNSLRGIAVVARKELGDYFSSLRFLVLVAIILGTGLLAANGAIGNMRGAIEQQGGDYAFLLLFTYSGGGLPSVISFLSFLGPLVGIVLGFDAISGERSRGSLSRILSQPIYRDTVVNAKFLAGMGVIAFILLLLGLAVCGVGMLRTGLAPSPDDLARILLFMVSTAVYMALWLAISIFFSIVFRHSATSSLCSLGAWVFFSIFVGVMARGVASAIAPVATGDAEAVYRNAQVDYLLRRLSPTILYNESVNTLLNPFIRAVGPIATQQMDGMIPGFLSIGESLLLILPHLIGIVALCAAFFAAAYIAFSRQEIRA